MTNPSLFQAAESQRLGQAVALGSQVRGAGCDSHRETTSFPLGFLLELVET